MGKTRQTGDIVSDGLVSVDIDNDQFKVGTGVTIYGSSGIISATSLYVGGTQFSAGISNVVEDTTPQLGGDLDLNSNDITGTGNLNVTGVITATSYDGQVKLSLEESDTTNYLTFTNDSQGYQTLKSNTGLAFNASNGTLTAAYFSGNGSNITNVNAATLDSIDSTSFLRSDQLDNVTSGGIVFNDNIRLNLGTGQNNDSYLFYDGTNANFHVASGDLILATKGGEYSGDDIIIESADDFEVRLNAGTNIGSGTTAIYATGGGSVKLNYNGSTKFETTSGGATVTGALVAGGLTYPSSDGSSGQVLTTNGQGTISFATVSSSGGGISNVVEDTTPQLGGNLQTNSNDILFADNDYARFGSGSLDSAIFHDGTNTNFFNYVGDLVIGTRGGEWAGDDVIIESADDFEVRLNTGTNSGSGTTAIYATGGGSVKLNHNGSTKFETISTGATITGDLYATNLYGDGSNLTGISTYSDSSVDSHLNTSSASANEVLSWTGTDYDWVAQSSGISNVVEDTTPQLGGDLDLNSNDITGTGNFNVTGVITATNFYGIASTASNVTVTTNNDTSNYKVVFASHTGSTTGNYGLLQDSTATFTYNPKTNTLTAVNFSGSGASLTGVLKNVVEDTTPQLGGDLDLNSNDITGTGNINITGTLNVSGISTFQNHVDLGDNDRLRFGDDGDFVIYHDGTNSVVADLAGATTGGSLYLSGSNSVIISDQAGVETLASFTKGGSAELYHDDVKKFETTTNGIAVSGIVTAISGVVTYYGDGSQLTGISAGGISNVVEDTTPQLGGDLETNGNDILFADNDQLRFGSATGGDFNIVHGTAGQVSYNQINVLNGNLAISDSSSNERVRLTNNGNWEIKDNSGTSRVTVTTSGATVTGALVAGGLTYPSSDGTNGQVLTTNGQGTLSFTTVSGGGGISSISEDTTPQLGGNLQSNGNNIILADTDLLKLGSGNFDFTATHDGTNTNFYNYVGDLYIGTRGGEWTGDDIIIESADDFEVRLNASTNPGSGTTAIYATGGGSVALTHNGSTKFETASGGIDVTGNIVVSGTVDGRDIATDGTKLDTIASSANNYSHPNHSGDVTSQADGATTIANDAVTYAKMQNVSATSRVLGRISQGSGVVEELTGANIRTIANVADGATAYSNSDVDAHLNQSNPTSGYVLSWNGQDYAWVAQSGGSSGISNVVEDTTPQLGGDLDLNSNDITGTGNINVTGNLDVSGISTLTNQAEVRSDDGSQGRIDFYCEVNNAHYTRIQAAAHSSYSGNATVTLPSSSGTLLLTDGSGANLTSLNASNLGSGTIPDARFPSTLPAVSGSSLTGLTGAAAATYGDGSNVAAITVDSNGRITGISEVAISGGGGASEAFKTITVSGQSDVVADSATDTLTLVAGSNMTITTNATNDTITFASSGSGGSSTLSGLTDVTISTPSNGQVLKYNGSAWVNDTDATGSGGGGSGIGVLKAMLFS